VLIEVAGTKRTKELPAAMLSVRQLDTFSMALRVVTSRRCGFPLSRPSPQATRDTENRFRLFRSVWFRRLGV